MITTHVLDTTSGKPAIGVSITLWRQVEDSWHKIGEGSTDSDGRLRTLMPSGTPGAPGMYRLTFDTGAYFTRLGLASFYPEVTIAFEVRDAQQHHHVPLLLSAFGYTTYRGS